MARWAIFPIEGYKGTIEVSDDGRVRRSNYNYSFTHETGAKVHSTKPDTELSCEIGTNGYKRVAIYVDGKRKRLYVHRMVGLIFVPGYAPRLTVNHINGNKLDNRRDNLEWISLAENTEKQWKAGLADLRGEKQPGHKVTEEDVRTIRRLVSDGVTKVHIARIMGISASLVTKIHKRQRWGWLD